MSKLKVGDKFAVTENHRFTSEITNGMKLEITSLKDIFGDSGLTFNDLYNGSYDADGNVFIGGVDKPLKPLIKKSELLSLIREQADVIEKLSRQVDCHHKDIIRIEGVIEPEPQLKQLDQSIFDRLDEKWRFAAVDSNGELCVFNGEPETRDFVFGLSDELDGATNYLVLSKGYDTSNWQNSLIERDTAKELLEVDLSSELTGSDLARAMLERGDRFVMCQCWDSSYADIEQVVDVINGFECTAYKKLFAGNRHNWEYATPINNQGEPLTAAEAGL